MLSIFRMFLLLVGKNSKFNPLFVLTVIIKFPLFYDYFVFEWFLFVITNTHNYT